MQSATRKSFSFPPGERWRLAIGAALATMLTLAGCAAPERRETQALYDLGPVLADSRSAAVDKGLPALIAGEISAPGWMDTSRMYYRLAYENPLEARTYAQARWSSPPARLFLQRLKTRVGQAGGAILGAADGATGLPVLRIEADDFSHVFTAPGQSEARVSMRISVLRDRRLIQQRSFTRVVAAPSADASGGVQALAEASDAVIGDMIGWLSTLSLPR